MDKSKLLEENVLPIENQKIKGKFKHVILIIPALDERWVTNRSFGYYVFPPAKLKNGRYSSGSKDEWLKTMSVILDDIWWLCELPYHKFWSQVIFHKEAMNTIRSFLHLAPLQKLYFRIEDEEIFSMFKRIKKAVFQFLKRISRSKESSLHFMGEKKYEEVMTNGNLVPISLIFCICSIYEREEQTEKMIRDLFLHNKSLRLDEAVMRTTQLFSYIHKKLRNSYKDMKKNIEYCECDDLSEILNTYRKSIVTAIQCATTAAMSISNFISVYKEGCNVLSNYDFEYHIIRTYKKLLVLLYQEVNLLFVGTPFEEVRVRLISMISISRIQFLKIFYDCLMCGLDKLSNKRESFDVVHNYVRIMKFSLKVEEFVFDFNSKYCVEEIAKAFKKCNSDIDLTEVNQINKNMIETYQKLKNQANDFSNDATCLNGTSTINENCLEEDFKNLKLDDPKEMSSFIENYCFDFDIEAENESETESIDSNTSHECCSSSEYSDWTKSDDSGSEYEHYLSGGESEGTDMRRKESKDFINDISSNQIRRSEIAYDQPGPSGVNTKNSQKIPSELDIGIAQVKDVLPHLGDGFIVMCLEHYKKDPSAVINAILEDNLVSSLKSIDRNLPFIPPDLLKDSNYNAITTNVARNERPLKELKKVDYASYTDMLNDKKEIETFKNMYEKYQIVSHDLYDDDVEEDYEEDVIAAIEADPESLYDSSIIHTTYDNLRNRTYVKSDDEFEKEESYEAPEPVIAKNPLDFCENPEITRARNEQRRRAKEEKRHKNSNYSNNRDKQSSSTNESNNTNRERHFKNVHKSKNANHSRRFLSDRKRRV